MTELLLRFLIGGLVVSAFATIGDLFHPKRFAGLFGAAPSVALATLGLTVLKDGKAYAVIEARSMLGGAVAFLVYAMCVSWLLLRYKPSAKLATLFMMPVWFGVAFGVWALWLR